MGKITLVIVIEIVNLLLLINYLILFNFIKKIIFTIYII
jgi:hypothetical protein